MSTGGAWIVQPDGTKLRGLVGGIVTERVEPEKKQTTTRKKPTAKRGKE